MRARRLSESRRLAIWHAAPDTPVTVWSVMDNATLERARSAGVVVPTPDYLADDDWREFRRAYDWMRRQMAARIPDYDGSYPTWGWLLRPSPRKGARTLTPCSLVEIVVPRKRLLLSDYDLWHHPLNNWSITDTEAEFDAEDVQPLTQSEKEATWAKIFDLSTETDPEKLRWLGGPGRTVQVCVAGVRMSEIRSVRAWRPIRSR